MYGQKLTAQNRQPAEFWEVVNVVILSPVVENMFRQSSTRNPIAKANLRACLMYFFVFVYTHQNIIARRDEPPHISAHDFDEICHEIANGIRSSPTSIHFPLQELWSCYHWFGSIRPIDPAPSPPGTGTIESGGKPDMTGHQSKQVVEAQKIDTLVHKIDTLVQKIDTFVQKMDTFV